MGEKETARLRCLPPPGSPLRCRARGSPTSPSAFALRASADTRGGGEVWCVHIVHFTCDWPREEADVKLLYFAWLRQKIGRAEEQMSPPASVTTVASLVDYLRTRGAGYEAAFQDLKLIRCAVNQEHTN